MRFIDKSKLVECKTDSWDEKAKQWSGRVEASADPSAEIKSIGNPWSSLKLAFVKKFGEKCWYTESPQIGTDLDVDHYWPKGRVKNADGQIVKHNKKPHPGYWWKAFDINNYRNSCIYANRGRDEGGKVDYFPLLDESKRAWNKNSPCDYKYHQILDPCCLEDVRLLSFEIEPGKTASITTEDINFNDYEKVRLSKTLLNLDHKTITPHRLRIIKETVRMINALKLFSRFKEEELDEEVRTGIVDAKDRLKQLCNRKNEFSAAAVQHLLPYKNDLYLADIVKELDLTP